MCVDLANCSDDCPECQTEKLPTHVTESIEWVVNNNPERAIKHIRQVQRESSDKSEQIAQLQARVTELETALINWQQAHACGYAWTHGHPSWGVRKKADEELNALVPGDTP